MQTNPRSVQNKQRHNIVSPQQLAERWGIGLKQANLTINATTQNGIQSALMPLSRRYRGDLFYQKKRLQGKWYTDTFHGRHISLNGFKYSQIFTNKQMFAISFTLKNKSEAGDALKTFISDYGVPEYLTFDGSKEQCQPGTVFMKQIKKHSIKYHTIESEYHDQNAAEGVIREVRRRWFRLKILTNTPNRLWDYGLQWVCDLIQRR